MKKLKIFLLLSIMITIFGACESNDNVNDYSKTERITLKTNIQQLSTRSVIDGIGDIPVGGLDVKFVRFDNLQSFNYSGKTPINGIISEGLLKLDENNPLSYYPTTTDKEIKLIGWYPASRYNSGSISTIDGDIDGETDLMITDFVVGSKANKFSSITFKHLLSYLVFNVIAKDQTAADDWGTITSIKVNNINTNYLIKLPTTPNSNSQITFSEQNTLQAKLINESNSIPIEQIQQAGYILIPPTSESESIELSITTTTKTDVLLTIPNIKFDTGKKYTINLLFDKSILIEQVSESLINEYVQGDTYDNTITA